MGVTKYNLLHLQHCPLLQRMQLGRTVWTNPLTLVTTVGKGNIRNISLYHGMAFFPLVVIWCFVYNKDLSQIMHNSNRTNYYIQ